MNVDVHHTLQNGFCLRIFCRLFFYKLLLFFSVNTYEADYGYIFGMSAFCEMYEKWKNWQTRHLCDFVSLVFVYLLQPFFHWIRFFALIAKVACAIRICFRIMTPGFHKYSFLSNSFVYDTVIQIFQKELIVGNKMKILCPWAMFHIERNLTVFHLLAKLSIFLFIEFLKGMLLR